MLSTLLTLIFLPLILHDAPLPDPVPAPVARLQDVRHGECLHTTAYVAYYGDCATAPTWQLLPRGTAVWQLRTPADTCLTRLPDRQLRLKPCVTDDTDQWFIHWMADKYTPTHHIFHAHDTYLYLGRGGYNHNRAHLTERDGRGSWFFMPPLDE